MLNHRCTRCAPVGALDHCGAKGHRLAQMGIMALGIILGVGFWISDAGYREETQIEIVKARITRTNPYQTEYEELLYPTVRISTDSGTGSGVVIGVEHIALSASEITILSAAHVVGDESLVFVEFFDYVKETTLEVGWVTVTDTTKDLALINVTVNKIYPYKSKLADKDYAPYIFTPVWVIGAPLGVQPRPTRGEITSIEDNRWSINAPIVPGNSGGGVFDSRTYELIGIAVSVRLYQDQLITTMGNIVPIQTIYQFLDDYKQTSGLGDANR